MFVTDEFAEFQYEVYRDAVGGVAKDGSALPTWKEFAADESKKVQADAWRAVAVRAIEKCSSVGLNAQLFDKTMAEVEEAKALLRALRDAIEQKKGRLSALRGEVATEETDTVAVEKVKERGAGKAAKEAAGTES